MTAISANQLRALAECADSRRNEFAYLVETPLGPQPYTIVDHLNPGQSPVLTLRTDNDPSYVPRVEPFTLSSDPKVDIDKYPDLGIAACDAIFTSVAAFEKFVIPYYTRFKAPSELDAMRKAYFSNKAALAVVHLPDSIETTANDDGTSLFVLLKVPNDDDVQLRSFASLIDSM